MVNTPNTDNMEIFRGKLYENNQTVYAQIGKSFFELKHVKNIEDTEELTKILKHHAVYLLSVSD